MSNRSTLAYTRDVMTTKPRRRSVNRMPFTLCLTLMLAAGCTRTEDAGPPAERTGEPTQAARSGAKPVIQVWKSPTCGCCEGWVEHLRAAGYPVEVENLTDLTAIKRERGIPGDLTSCHTGLVDGYALEGHVPADVIDRMLAERPEIAGLAVPGMPTGSPGMEVPGVPADEYDIVAFTAGGEPRVYERR